MSQPPRRVLVLLRHGRTGWNAAGRVQGQVDEELDATGHAQAAAAAPALAAMRPARLVTSDLARARSTAGYVADATGLTATPDPRLREYHLGEREGLAREEYAAAHPREHARFNAGDFDVVPGGETAADVRTRVLPALREALAGTRPGEVVVAVSHGAAIKVATAGMLGWPADAHLTLRVLENCAWVELEVPDDHEPDARVRLRAYDRRVAQTD